MGPVKRIEEIRGNWNNAVDNRILDTPFRQSNSRIQILSQTQKIKKFSKESKDLIAEMNNTEIFEFCENSSKKQCLECNTYWETGIIHRNRGKNMKSLQRPEESEKNNYDVSSIPDYGIQKNGSRGVKHGPSEQQGMHHRAKEMLQKVRQE